MSATLNTSFKVLIMSNTAWSSPSFSAVVATTSARTPMSMFNKVKLDIRTNTKNTVRLNQLSSLRVCARSAKSSSNVPCTKSVTIDVPKLEKYQSRRAMRYSTSVFSGTSLYVCKNMMPKTQSPASRNRKFVATDRRAAIMPLIKTTSSGKARISRIMRVSRKSLNKRKILAWLICALTLPCVIIAFMSGKTHVSNTISTTSTESNRSSFSKKQ
mmetsp:Transcript_39667/g.69727  ORF Transcript_39667/g.69727 Transcript_39667/m.69727 type:complete len:214 (-) Transcript_39667:181-822(-)